MHHCIVLFTTASLSMIAAPAVAPTAAHLREQAGRCRSIMEESLVRFYLPGCVDEKNGGYYESLRDKQFVPTGEKFLTLQSRQLWFFSTLASEGIQREKALAAAQHGYNFIRTKMRDPVHGGYFSKVTDAGDPKDSRKHAYLNSFALYALVAYHRASGDIEALAEAKALFRTLEEKSHDREHGGYVEFFARDWTPVSDPKAQGYVGAIGHKTYNTHLHLLESLTELHRIWPDELVRQRLFELITINISSVHHRTHNANVDAWHRDWKIVNEPRNLRASYGHDVECIWLVSEAAATAGLSKSTLLNWAEGLASYSIEHGYDRAHGGFYSGGPLGAPADDTKKVWWVQAEALVGMLEMYRLSGNTIYYDLFSKTLDFIEKHQVAREGSWWATRSADGSPTSDKQRSSPWHGAYHGGRAMILSAKWLEELAR
jgi:cellobiose epimerase